jgi:hypothetical protein
MVFVPFHNSTGGLPGITGTKLIREALSLRRWGLPAYAKAQLYDIMSNLVLLGQWIIHSSDGALKPWIGMKVKIQRRIALWDISHPP